MNEYFENCPVPKAQRPLNEYNELLSSWFFSWPFKNNNVFYKRLIYSWIFFIPIFLLISSGSVVLNNSYIKLSIISIVLSLSIPILILFRYLISWNYIYYRLLSENVEYEETGWYDGQTWEKPIEWKEKEYLIAKHEIKPILNITKKLLSITISILILGILIFFNLIIKI